MKVYVLTSTCICVDNGDCESRVVGVYENVDKALKQMAQEINGARACFEGYDAEEDNYAEGDMNWSIWEKEQYMSHHCDIQIAESEVQK